MNKSKKTIALVSDSHGRIDRLEMMFQRLQDAGIDTVFHAGDFLVYGVDEVLAKFPAINIYIAQGNADVNEEILRQVKSLSHITIKQFIRFEIFGKHILMAHKPADLHELHTTNPANILCHGHTHVPRAVQSEGSIVLNPGALTDDGGYFLIDLPIVKVKRLTFDQKLD